MILNDFSNTIKQLFYRELNYELSDNQIMKFYDYMNFLISENKKYNLTAITDPYDIINKHFLDSCELLRFVDLSFGNKHYIDIGCGAGFPSVPLAILFENSSFTLVDSVNKKLSFINELSNRINLQNIITFHARAEDIGHDLNYIEKFDYCLSRAVSKISVVLEYSSQFLSIGGSLFIYKMLDTEQELKLSQSAQQKLYLHFNDNIQYSLYDNSERTIYRFCKSKETPRLFPRKAGIPTKNPL